MYSNNKMASKHDSDVMKKRFNFFKSSPMVTFYSFVGLSVGAHISQSSEAIFTKIGTPTLLSN